MSVWRIGELHSEQAAGRDFVIYGYFLKMGYEVGITTR